MHLGKDNLRKIVCRQLRKEDIEFAYELNKAETWNDRIEDLERMLEYEPEGCFLAEMKGIPVGHVFSVNYGKLGWVGLLIVGKAYRRMGVGRSLMLMALRYLLKQGVETIKLEAVPEISKLYRDMEFVNEYDSLRFRGTRIQVSAKESQSAIPMNANEIDEIAKFDSKYFGAERARIITKLHQAYPQLCFVSRSDSRILGYIMCRRAESGYNVGPWVCMPESKDIATDLLATCLNEIDSEAPIYIGVPATNESAAEILRRFGFSSYSKSIRMRFGRTLQNECVEGIFGIGGPMKG